MSLIWSALGSIAKGFGDSLFGWLRQRQADQNLIRADRAETAIEGMQRGEAARQEINQAAREAQNDANVDMSDWN